MTIPFSFTQLSYVVAVDQQRHFAKAATACFVSQPTLSMQIRKLEDQLGVLIFDRSCKPIETTDIGKLIVQQAKAILREAAGIELLIEQTQQNFSGTLTLGILPTLAPYIMPLVAGAFKERFPQIFLRVQELTTTHIIAGIENDELDAGLIATQEDGHKLTEMPLFEEKFVNFVSTSHRFNSAEKIAHTDLDLKDIWLLSDGHCFRDQVLNLCLNESDAGQQPPMRQPFFDCGYFDTLIRMVEQVDGMTLLPELAVLFLSEQQKALLRPFAGDAPTRTIYLVSNQRFLKTSLINAFVSTLMDAVSPHVRRIDDGYELIS